MRQDENKNGREDTRVTRRGGTRMYGNSTPDSEKYGGYGDDRAPRGEERREYRDDRDPRDDRDYRRERDPRDDRDYRRERDPRDDRDYRRERDPRDDRDYRRDRDPRDDRDYRRERDPRDDRDYRRERDPRDDRDYRRERDPRDDRDYRRDRDPRDDRDYRRDRDPRDSRDSRRGGSTGQTRGASRGTRPTQKVAQPRPGSGTESFLHQIVPYVMFWMGLFAAVSFVLRDVAKLDSAAGAFGNWFANFLGGLFGIGAYLLPAFLVVLSLRWRRYLKNELLGKKLFLYLLFLFLLSGIIHVFQDPNQALLMTSPGVLYAAGVARTGGGFFGGFVGEWMGFCLRGVGTGLLAIPLLLIVAIYLVGLTPLGLWQRLRERMKLMRRRAREERGAIGAAPAEDADAPKPAKDDGDKDEGWCDPQPLVRSGGTRLYDFHEDEPDVSVEPSRRGEKQPAAKQTPPAAQKEGAPAEEPVEVVDIPDDEPDVAPASPAAKSILHQAGAVAGADALQSILEELEREEARDPQPQATPEPPAPAQPAATTPPPTDDDVFAPFGLPVRPERMREQPGNGQRIVITPRTAAENAAYNPTATSTPASPAAPAATVDAKKPEDEVLGNPQATPAAARTPYGAAPAQPAYTPAEPVTFGEPPAPAQPAYTPAEPVTFGEPPAPAQPAYTPAQPIYEPADEVEIPDADNDEFDFDELREEANVPVQPTPTQTYTPTPVGAAERSAVPPVARPAYPATPPAAPQQAAPAPVAERSYVADEEPPLHPMDDYEYVKPPVQLLNPDQNVYTEDFYGEIKSKKELLRQTLESFRIGIQEQIDHSHGPTVTRYEFRPLPGVSVRSITTRIEDLSLSFASSVRIEAPIPGKPAIGVEVPNEVRENVYLRPLLETEYFRNSTKPLEVPLGLDIGGRVRFCNLAKMPHLLVAGTTGSGKSVCINTILLGMMFKTSPKDLRFILIDPKQIEFSPYEKIPHLYLPVIVDMKRAAGALACAVREMERRFALIRDTGVKSLESYNELAKNDPNLEHLPYIVIVIDEFADLKMSATNNDVEMYTCRLAQKARAAGMHLIIGTQRPSATIITGNLKTNIPSRIAFMVNQQVDSRIILDDGGAETLIGQGDMLFKTPESKEKAPARIQGAFVSDPEIKRITEFIVNHNDPVPYNQEFIDQIEIEIARTQNAGKKGGIDDYDVDGDGAGGSGEDSKFREAVEIAINAGKLATSLLQRRLGVGYGRAAKIIDRMEQLGLLAPAEGNNKPRQVLMDAARGYLAHMGYADDDMDVGGPDEFQDYG